MEIKTKEAPNLAVWRFLVLERDDYTCRDCNKKFTDKELEAHHEDTDRNHKLVVGNGVTLCIACHKLRHQPYKHRIKGKITKATLKRKKRDNHLISILVQRQVDMGLSDGAMSRFLGIHYSNWSRIKNEQRPLSIDIIKIIAKKFPELKGEIDKYIYS